MGDNVRHVLSCTHVSLVEFRSQLSTYVSESQGWQANLDNFDLVRYILNCLTNYLLVENLKRSNLRLFFFIIKYGYVLYDLIIVGLQSKKTPLHWTLDSACCHCEKLSFFPSNATVRIARSSVKFKPRVWHVQRSSNPRAWTEDQPISSNTCSPFEGQVLL